MSCSNVERHADKKFQRGNVLFLILIAVALFAALSYAISQSNRAGTGDVSREKADLIANQILQHAFAIQQTVDRLRLSGGVPLENIDFYRDDMKNVDGTAHGTYDNTRCANTDATCAVYLNTPKVFVGDAMVDKTGLIANTLAPGYFFPLLINVWGLGGDAPDLVLNMYVSVPVCEAIQDKMGLPKWIQDEWEGAFIGWEGDLLAGSPAQWNRTDAPVFGDDIWEIIGKKMGCYQVFYGKHHGVFFYTLVER